jgi:phospholipid/cholesterol/gamma-HCH transport system substrate-binding protein
MSRLLRALALVVLVATLATSCSLRTAGSPQGDLELTATFDDVANLVVGHSVQLADVAVGTVTAIDLVDGRRARVTMSIQDDVDLPVGTSAALSKTSLLGEQYVELRPPDEATPVVGGPQLLHSGDEIGETSITADFETVTERAIEFLGAISADDIGTITNTGARALGGRGRDLNRLLGDLTTVVGDLDSQRNEIARTIDGFAQLTDDLASHDGQVGTLIADLSDASVTLARNRHRIIGALRGIRDMTLVTNQAVLADHTDSLVSTIQDLDPILSTLAGQRPRLEEMLDSVNAFLADLDDNVSGTSPVGQSQFVWAKGIATPSGTLGEGPSPVPDLPTGPPSGGTPVAPAVNQALNTLLGLLGDPDVRLPMALCRRLDRLGVPLDLSTVCAARPGQGGGSLPVPDVGGAVDQVLGGVGG